MKTRVELKMEAKTQMNGNLGGLILCTIINIAIVFVLGLIPIVGSIAVAVIAPALGLGITMIYIGVTNGIKAEVNNLFDGFSYLGKAFVLNLLISIFTSLWSLLFVIPGIVKGISYSMAMYILAENPQMTASEALNESKRITNGYKMDLFVLSLSFIPWMLLCGITFGLAGLYVIPYMNLTFVNFYHNIKNNA